MAPEPGTHRDLPPFDRRFFEEPDARAVLGEGALGGKATGLVRAAFLLQRKEPGRGLEGLHLRIPRFLVLATGLFETFLEHNGLTEVIQETPRDDHLAHAFVSAELPIEIVGDLRTLVSRIGRPLAVRSSSLLEDAAAHPFAGVYLTKMVPNRESDTSRRFQALAEAVKLVWASTFFAGARAYAHSIGRDAADERMAVVIQEVVGQAWGDRFYPEISGVAKSHDYYPFGRATPEDGVVHLLSLIHISEPTRPY